MFSLHNFMLRGQMGASRYNNPFDIIPSIVYSIFVQKSCTIVANNRTIFTFFANFLISKNRPCATATNPSVPFYTSSTRRKMRGSAAKAADPYYLFIIGKGFLQGRQQFVIDYAIGMFDLPAQLFFRTSIAKFLLVT